MKISKELRMPISSVQTLIKKWKMRDSVETKPRSDRPKVKLSATTARKSVRDAKKNSQMTSAEIQEKKWCGCFKMHNKKACEEKWACMAELPEESHYYTNATKKSHFQYAKQHRDKSQNFRNKIIQSDETKIELVGHNHKRYIWRGVNKAYDKRYTIPTVKRGGGLLMFWGCELQRHGQLGQN